MKLVSLNSQEIEHNRKYTFGDKPKVWGIFENNFDGSPKGIQWDQGDRNGVRKDRFSSNLPKKTGMEVKLGFGNLDSSKQKEKYRNGKGSEGASFGEILLKSQ